MEVRGCFNTLTLWDPLSVDHVCFSFQLFSLSSFFCSLSLVVQIRSTLFSPLFTAVSVPLVSREGSSTFLSLRRTSNGAYSLSIYSRRSRQLESWCNFDGEKSQCGESNSHGTNTVRAHLNDNFFHDSPPIFYSFQFDLHLIGQKVNHPSGFLMFDSN